MSFLLRYPHLLEVAYQATHVALRPFRRWLTPDTWVERVFIGVERASKGAIFDCRMCGQCVLHSTGMTCPMTCPKNLRNGPCGGVRTNGHCEVIPEMKCVWVEAWERSQRMPDFGREIHDLVAPLNQHLQGTSAWINDSTGEAQVAGVGWTIWLQTKEKERSIAA